MTDFFDPDLVKRRDTAAREVDEKDTPSTAGPQKAPKSDAELSRMARHKEKVEDEVAEAIKELEKLRQRQTDLEKQKAALDDLHKKQRDYEAVKSDLNDRLTQSMVQLEKEEVRASQRAALLNDSRKEIRERLEEIAGIDEDEWTDATIRDELNKALTLLDDTQTEYRKIMARIEALDSLEGGISAISEPTPSRSSLREPQPEKGFWSWFLVGIAVTLPLILTLVILAVVLYIQGAAHL